NQQQIILRLIEHDRGAKRTRIVTKESWTVLLKAAGLSEDDMRKWHVEFERAMPEAHQDFLESLGLGAEEIRAIRTWSRAGDGARQGRGGQRRISRRKRRQVTGELDLRTAGMTPSPGKL